MASPIFAEYAFKSTKYSNVRGSMHTNLEMEIVLVHEGVLNMNVNGIEHEIHEGEGIFVLPFEPHDFRSLQDNICHVLMFNDKYSSVFFKQVNKGEPKTRVFPLSSSLQNYLCDQLDKNKREHCYYNSILFPLFDAIKESCEFGEEECFNETFLAVLSYIDKHLTEDITETEIAAALYIHPVTLSRIFSKQAKMHIKKYINRRRVILAKQLIENGEKITKAAYDLGFGSIRNFNRAFKEYYSYTPSALIVKEL